MDSDSISIETAVAVIGAPDEDGLPMRAPETLNDDPTIRDTNCRLHSTFLDVSATTVRPVCPERTGPIPAINIQAKHVFRTHVSYRDNGDDVR